MAKNAIVFTIKNETPAPSPGNGKTLKCVPVGSGTAGGARKPVLVPPGKTVKLQTDAKVRWLIEPDA